MTLWKHFTRRNFLIVTGGGLSSVLIGCPPTQSGGRDNSTAKKTNTALSTDAGSGFAQNTNDAGAAQNADAGDETITDCSETDNDIQGPFYREGVPVRSELDLYGDAGTALTLSGLVLNLDCQPIPNAVVEIWHADPTPKAVDELVDSDSVDYDNTSDEMRYRGQIATDVNGRYSFHTKKPGWYLNAGTFRPMHIHVKVWVGETNKLTTQLYFQGDPYIQGDPWASLDRAVALSPDGAGAEKGTFNFTVA